MALSVLVSVVCPYFLIPISYHTTGRVGVESRKNASRWCEVGWREKLWFDLVVQQGMSQFSSQDAK